MECLGEEMRRVLAYFEWKAEWWLQRGGWRANEGEDMQEALNAYAAKEAQVLWDMGDSFADQWYPLLVSQGIDPKWPSRSSAKVQKKYKLLWPRGCRYRKKRPGVDFFFKANSRYPPPYVIRHMSKYGNYY